MDFKFCGSVVAYRIDSYVNNNLLIFLIPYRQLLRDCWKSEEVLVSRLEVVVGHLVVEVEDEEALWPWRQSSLIGGQSNFWCLDLLQMLSTKL